MTPQELVHCIQSSGGSVRVEGGSLRVSAPPGLLTEAHREILREHKQDLLAYLTKEQEPVDQDAGPDLWEEAVEPIPCGSCGGLLAWWDARDIRHCMTCQPLTKTEQVLAHAESIRLRKYIRRGDGPPNPFRREGRLIGWTVRLVEQVHA